ncbi:lipase [Wolbachia endosymbiont of Spodoptera picta]|uniref:lipase family protein n=1 Tax=Wolbachia endosymbiont of Spodoptera picta TaxID=2769078 RepID=UPI001BADF0F5|nr:lipase [Wolbachia endosymbiont of Spodoptera picta]QUI60615.1 lipase [Wolbachia endosymbiont of Spodoptera picta]
MPSITHGQSMDSISDSIVHIGGNEIKECAIEALEPFKNELEAQSFDLNGLGTSDLIKAWKKIEDFKGAGLKDAFDLADLIKGQIAGFNKEKLQEMCTFSKISYGNVDRKLKQDEYKTKRQFEEEGYQIIKFYDNELIEDKYCSDTDYKLEQQDVGYALMSSNSYNRDAGYVFIKGQEVTIAYHGTRDLNDVKEDLRASLAKLSFLPEDHRVHSGFYSLFKRSWPSVHKILKGHANDKGLAIKDLKINVTGHSMGGALANIAALCLNKTEDAEDVHVATFGSPRVFYNGAAEVYNQCLGNKTIRVACQSDPVPCLPHGNAGMHYKHVGKSLKLETGKTLEYLELHYHRINIYYNLVREVEQENFKSDNNPSKYRHIAYIFGLFYHAVLSYVDVNDKEFFKKVEEENKDIKLSEIPIQYAPKLEEKIKLLEQEVAKPTNDKTQLEGRLKSIQQSLVGKTKELDDEKGKLTQEQQKTNQLNDQIDKLTAEFKGTKDQLAEKKAELDEQTRTVTKLNDTIKELKETNAELERKNSNLANRLEKLEEAKTKLEEKVEFAEKELRDAKAQFRESERGLREVKAQLEQENSNLSSQARELEGKCGQTEVQLVESEQKLAEETSKVMQLSKESNEARAQLEKKKKEIGKLKDQVDQMTIQNNQLEGQLDDAKQGLTDKTDEVTRLTQVADTLNGRVAQLTTQNDQLEGQLDDARQSFADQIMQRENENNDLKTKLQEIENKSEVLEKSLQKQFESKNEELSEKFLKARTYSKRQGNYASVSFVLSGAFAVGTSLTMVHLAMCVSLAVAALTFLAVGCYCSYNANTALNNVEVSQIGNDLSHSLV